MKKFLAVLFFTASFSFTAFAGEWQERPAGYQWKNDDGTYSASTWQWIDGNEDGTAECYYFDKYGCLLTDTVTPDSFTVNADGCWVVDGVVQTLPSDSSQTALAAPPQLPASTEQPEQETPPAASSGFDFSTENIAMKYTGHEIGTDDMGQSCVIIYYDYTNKSDSSESALWSTMTRVYQHDERCDDAFLSVNTNQPFEDYYIDIKPGQTIRVAEAFTLTDMSEITVIVYEFLCEDEASQTVTLKLQ